MEGEFNFALLGILLGGAALVALLVNDDDDGDGDTDDGRTAGSPSEDGSDLPTVTPDNPDGDNSIGGGGSIDVSQSQRFQMGAGNDTVFAGGGDDVIVGGTGNDSMNGATGSDVIYGGSGDDIAIGGFGDDRIAMGLGDDQNISNSMLNSLTSALDGSNSISDIKGALAGLNQQLFREMGGDDNIEAGAVTSGTDTDDTDGDDIVFDLIGSNSIAGSLGDDILAGFDRDGSGPGGVPTGDELFGGFGADIVWADNGDTVQLDPLDEGANKSADTLFLAEALAERGPDQATDDGESLDANDYVTVVDFDTSEDKLVLVSDTIEADDLEFVQVGDNVHLKAGNDVLANFTNASVSDFGDLDVKIEANPKA